MQRSWPLIATLCACSTASSTAVDPWRAQATVSVTAPWTMVQDDRDVVALRYGDTAHGARIHLGPHNGWPLAGVSAVVDGRSIGAPMVGVSPHIVPALHVAVSSEGHDLVVRFSAQDQDTLTDHPSAPSDPALTWVRLRPRNGSWRVVVDGLAQIALPADDIRYGSDGQLLITGAAGSFELHSDALASTSTASGHSWTFDTFPSLERRAPYPRTAFTYRPDGEVLSP